MSTIAVENRRLSNWLKWELAVEVAYCRKEVVVNDAAADLVTGTVLGKVTATGKYKVSVETAVDGSEVPAGILIYDTSVAAATDKQVAILAKGPAIVGAKGIILDDSFDDDAKVAAAHAALEAVGINVVAQIGV